MVIARGKRAGRVCGSNRRDCGRECVGPTSTANWRDRNQPIGSDDVCRGHSSPNCDLLSIRVLPHRLLDRLHVIQTIGPIGAIPPSGTVQINHPAQNQEHRHRDAELNNGKPRFRSQNTHTIPVAQSTIGFKRNIFSISLFMTVKTYMSMSNTSKYNRVTIL